MPTSLHFNKIKNIASCNLQLRIWLHFSRESLLIIFTMIHYKWVTNDECSTGLQWTIAKGGPPITWSNRHINSSIWFIDKWNDQSNQGVGKMYWRHKELQLGKNCQNLSRFWLGSKLGQKIRSPRIGFYIFPFLRKWKNQKVMNSQTENGHGNMTEVGQLKGLGLETHLVTNSEVTLPTSLNGIAGSSQLPSSSIAGIISKYTWVVWITVYDSYLSIRQN